MLVFTEKLERKKRMVNQDETVQEGLMEPETQVDHQGATVLNEPVNGQPETSICVQGTEGQGHYENREINGDQEGYVLMNREVMTLTQGGATYDNIQNYENRAFIKNDEKNDYEGLQITRDEHLYADL